MSKQHPVVLYVGSEANAQELYEFTRFDNWMIYHPQDMEEALAMHVFEYPDVIVIEDSSSVRFARDVYAHLSSINEECILLLTDRPETWSIPFESLIRVAPDGLHVDEIVTEIRAKLGHVDMELAL